MQPAVLDTDVASHLHKGTLTGPLGARLIGRRPVISFVTYGELTKWVEVRDWGGRRRQEMADWLSGVPVLLGDEAVAATWGRLAAAGQKAGRPQPTNDMWIAACCLAHDLPLATLNIKDYRYFQETHGLRLLGEE